MVKVPPRNMLYEGLNPASKDDLASHFSVQQRASFSRWAKHYGYNTWYGYITARNDIEWSDYGDLREHSP